MKTSDDRVMDTTGPNARVYPESPVMMGSNENAVEQSSGGIIYYDWLHAISVNA